MKKYFSRGLLASFIIASVFSLSSFINITPVSAQTISLCQLLETLIKNGAVSPDRADIARVNAGCVPTVVVPPTATSTQNFVSIVGTPSLELFYDSTRKESQLKAMFKLSIQAGVGQDLRVYKNSNPITFLNQTDGRDFWNKGTLYPMTKVTQSSD